jgi:hypothetical protein
VRGKEKYLSAVNPSVGTETNGIAEGEEEDEDDTSIVRGMVFVILVNEGEDGINLHQKVSSKYHII